MTDREGGETGTGQTAGVEAAGDLWEHLAWCPNCAARLERRQCKARCFRCGYFQDCSDTIV